MAVRPRSDVIRCHSDPPSVTDMSISAWPSMRPTMVPTEKCSEEKDQYDHHHRRADEFGQGELPAQKRHDDDTEFENEIGRSHFERHRSREIRTLAEDRAGKRHGRIGA